MKKFLFETLGPLLVVIIIYFAFDPFKVIRSYSSYYTDGQPQLVALDKDFVSLKTYQVSPETKKYDSFIFGNSCSMFYNVADWKKFLKKESVPYHFDASSETLYGIEKKIEYISNNGKLTDVLIVADANLLKQDKPKKGHLYAISPELVHYTNFVPFHLSFFKAAIDPKLSLSIIAYKMLGRRIGSIVDDRVLSYDSIHNEVRFRLFEDEIKKGCYYNESRMKVFYQRDSIGNYSESVLGENQISLLNRINDIVRSNNARCKIVISPLYDQVKFNNRDLKILEDIFGKHSVYDFSGVNDITEDYHNYYETAHYRPKAAAYILNRVYQ